MAVKKLDALSALGSGSDVWIIAGLDDSKWARKIDWYLNFQLMRAEPRHVGSIAKPSIPLLGFVEQAKEQWDFEMPKVQLSEAAPLMIASSSLLPNVTTVQVTLGQGDESWVAQCHRIWSNLGRPSLRVFLPGAMSSEKFAKQWSKVSEKSPAGGPVEGSRAKESIEVVGEDELLNV